jgi:phthiodiolone/phenolphthiodiolone dimycocerosates ketoreductase
LKRTRFGIALVTTVPEMVRTAILAERLGFDSIWTPDETVGYEMEYGPKATIPDAFGALTAIAMKTKRILLGTSVVDSLIRPPVKTAQIAATLDSVSSGRLLLGLGGSEAGNHEPFGIQTDHPFVRLRETIKTIRLLWKSNYGRRANFAGKYYSLKDAYLRMKPSRAHGPPIYVAAFGPRMLSLVGEFGDGWIPFGHTPETYRDRLNDPVRKSLEKNGRSLGEIDPACIVPMSISRDGGRAQREAIHVGKSYLVWSADNWSSLLPELPHPGIRQTQLKTLDNLQRLTELSKRVPDKLALDLTVSGTSQNCANQIERFTEGGVRHLIFAPVAEDETRRARMLRQLWTVIARL